MATIDTIRDRLIDKLLTISNKEYLNALNELVEKSVSGDKLVQLTDAQIEMLKLSDKDIESGNLISHEDLNKNDLKWLNEL
ncbi:hypothetical protein [Mucilaginibacter sp. L3T2-6]|uniref:hypothetical protein n=1 Tax=Mucilaginibacter sp. L3T2-6 TaxID=3062491 RepID=UPI002674B959|nr:hypothetical protein [Mucilaginibacter sp. L3T2-6]MDO3640769.1 hypothetical protein [Mucilaginibacter sp. L3T2-6]MDV6212890.1 hypothetical protein [Mucilaginibacter sp. L3T2-6]